MYAIVDIETTGGYAEAGGITEISIYIHDGSKVVQHYETLINPQQDIPYYIESLTGINNALVENAPVFEAVSGEIYELLKDHIFVAHNVNFDYSFVKHYLSQCGYSLDTKKLCTVRLSRKLLPGLPSYSLGNLCRHLKIHITNRHRAGGDAAATVILFEHLLQQDTGGYMQQCLKKGSREQSLPPNLPKEQLEQLPGMPGVYYFHDQKGRVIYVGKAKNIRKRVSSHFTNNNPGKQKQEFLRNIYSITYEVCGTELMAFILESVEIKRLWPLYNRSQKTFEQAYALYAFEDQNSYLRLAIGRRRKQVKALHTFRLLTDGHQLMRKLIRNFRLCPRLCFMQSGSVPCTGVAEGTCEGACEQREPATSYNQRVQEAIHHLQDHLPGFAIVDKGREEGEQSCILVEQGQLYGMGYVTGDTALATKDELKEYLTQYPGNDYIRNMLYHYAEAHREKIVKINIMQG